MQLIQPESNLKLNILVLGSSIIEILNSESDPVIVDDLLNKFLKKDKKRSVHLFFDTLTLLYLIDIVTEENYRIKINKFKKRTSKLTDFL